MRSAVFFGIGLAATSAACAQPQETRMVSETAGYPLRDGAAQVCVVRPETLARNVSMPVRDNGRLVGATRGATYVCWIATPGEHQITSVDDDTGPTLFQARAGGRYWLHQETSELAGALHAHLDWVDEATALELIDSCEARVRVAVPGHDDEPSALRIAPAKARR